METQRQQVKIIILGISGSGKSTFAKQMKILHSHFEEEEISFYKSVIIKNIFVGIRELLKASTRFDIKVTEENLKHAQKIEELGANVYNLNLDEENKKMIMELWADAGVQEMWAKSSEFQIQMNNYEYLMENIERISSPDYTPTFDDILRARQITTGAQILAFSDEKRDWEFTDVGGQIPERNKWTAIMESGVDCIIYFMALDEYNIISSEEEGLTKYEIAKRIWSEVTDVEFRDNVCLILCLNKIDIFQEKIKDKHHWKSFRKTFPDYEGEREWEQCAEYIKDEFLGCAKVDEEDPSSLIFHHYSCAVDTEAMKQIWGKMKDFVFLNRTKEFFS